MNERLWRVYFAARDAVPCSRILCADIDPGDGFRVLRVHPEPVLDLGAAGTFDSHGMGPSTVLVVDGRIHLYYTGIARRSDVPYQTAIGLAVSADGLSFRKASGGPVLSTGPRDPFFMSTPHVRRTATGFEMWYASGVEWRNIEGRLEPFYVLRRTRSDDGIIWSLATELALGFDSEGEAGLVRPWVMARRDGFDLWYCSRGGERFREPGLTAYRLRHATTNRDGGRISNKAIEFQNPPAGGEWDDWMQAYPCVEALGKDLIMFYNGNDFGRGGFGYARLVGGAKRLQSPVQRASAQ